MKAYSDLNAIEKKLQDRSCEELIQIVDKFIFDLNQLKDKYKGKSFLTFNPEKSTTCMSTNEFKSQILFALKENMVDNMVAAKSKELLDKLEIL